MNKNINQISTENIFLALIGTINSGIKVNSPKEIYPKYFTIIKKIEDNYYDLFNNKIDFSIGKSIDKTLVIIKTWHLRTNNGKHLSIEDVIELENYFNEIFGYSNIQETKTKSKVR